LPPVEATGVSAGFAVTVVSAEVVAGVPVGVEDFPALLPAHPIPRNTLNKINKITNSFFI
jgi:hypothetical protein